MDAFIRFLDVLRDVPAWGVAAGGFILVAVLLWWIVGKLFRSPRGESAADVQMPSAPPPPPPLSEAGGGPEVMPKDSAEGSVEDGPSAAEIASQLSPPDDPLGESRAVSGFRKTLIGKGLADGEVNVLVGEYSSQLNDARLRLAEIARADVSDGEIVGKLGAVAKSLDNGRFDDALTELDGLGEMATEKGRDTRERAEQELNAAALARLVAGDLSLASREPEAAERHYRLALETLPAGSDALLAECLNKHGTAAYRANKLEIAAMSFRRAVKLLERLKGPQDPDVATALNNLAMLYYARGDLNAAEPLYRRALDIDEAVSGKNSTPVATDLNNLALLLKEQGRAPEAEPLLKRALEIKEQRLVHGHPSLITGIRNYAAILRLNGREAEADGMDARAAEMTAAGPSLHRPAERDDAPASDRSDAGQGGDSGADRIAG